MGLRNLNHEKYEQHTMLRRYMRQNAISTSLSARIWMWLKVKESQTRRRLHERDIQILRVLPSKIIVEIQEQVYAPAIIAHPFFFQFSVVYPTYMKKLYACIQEASIGKGK